MPIANEFGVIFEHRLIISFNNIIRIANKST